MNRVHFKLVCSEKLKTNFVSVRSHIHESASLYVDTRVYCTIYTLRLFPDVTEVEL